MENVKILKEIIETLEKHNEEFSVVGFDSNIYHSEAEKDLTYFNIKFDLKPKEKPIETISVNIIQPEEAASETIVPVEEPKEVEPKIEECVEVPEPEPKEEELQLKPKKKKTPKMCGDCINCYEKDGEYKCCKGIRENITKFTYPIGCLEFIRK